MNSLEQDIAEREQHARKLELLKAQNAKVVKLQAKRDIEVARANSRQFQEARLWKWGFTAAAVVILGVSSCSAVVFHPTSEGEMIKQQKYELCVSKGGDWDNATEDCEQ